MIPTSATLTATTDRPGGGPLAGPRPAPGYGLGAGGGGTIASPMTWAYGICSSLIAGPDLAV